jgi:hypothetical protein
MPRDLFTGCAIWQKWSLFATPTLISGILGDFLALFGTKRIGAGPAALQAALAAQRDGRLIFARIFWGYRRFVFDLASQNIAYQLAELDGVAGARKAIFCHDGIMAWKAKRFKG